MKNAFKQKGDVDTYVDFVNLINKNGLNYNHYTTSVKYANFNAVTVYDFKDKIT